jgi:hypothetical protein
VFSVRKKASSYIKLWILEMNNFPKIGSWIYKGYEGKGLYFPHSALVREIDVTKL